LTSIVTLSSRGRARPPDNEGQNTPSINRARKPEEVESTARRRSNATEGGPGMTVTLSLSKPSELFVPYDAVSEESNRRRSGSNLNRLAMHKDQSKSQAAIHSGKSSPKWTSQNHTKPKQDDLKLEQLTLSESEYILHKKESSGDQSSDTSLNRNKPRHKQPVRDSTNRLAKPVMVKKN
jgi:hypothetical protein